MATVEDIFAQINELHRNAALRGCVLHALGNIVATGNRTADNQVLRSRKSS